MLVSGPSNKHIAEKAGSCFLGCGLDPAPTVAAPTVAVAVAPAATALKTDLSVLATTLL